MHQSCTGVVMRYSTVPWWLDNSDLHPAGGPEYVRECRHERHVGMVVSGSIDHGLVLGMVAIRCERGGAFGEVPLGMALPDTMIDVRHNVQQSRTFNHGPDGYSVEDRAMD